MRPAIHVLSQLDADLGAGRGAWSPLGLTGSGYVQTMNAANLQTVEDTLLLHDKLTGVSRRKTLQAMRRDLLPWWHFSSRDLRDKPQVVA